MTRLLSPTVGHRHEKDEACSARVQYVDSPTTTDRVLDIHPLRRWLVVALGAPLYGEE